MANSVDPDETPRSAASHQGLHCLLRPVCPNTYGKFGIRCSQSDVYQYKGNACTFRKWGRKLSKLYCPLLKNDLLQKKTIGSQMEHIFSLSVDPFSFQKGFGVQESNQEVTKMASPKNGGKSTLCIKSCMSIFAG